MEDFRRKNREFDHLCGTNSVILDERFVSRALNGEKTDTSEGDVIDGVRNGLIIGAAIWTLLFLAAHIFVR